MKIRLDNLLVEQKIAENRSKALGLIMAGEVLVNDKIISKAGTMVDNHVQVILKNKFPYVSRGALKLEKAFYDFELDFENKIVCDIGASTGGFTDFALQKGAKYIYAIDVGHGQLDQKLRIDPRVVVMERTDFRAVKSLPEVIDIFLCDVSFISIVKILGQLKTLTDKEKYQKVKLVALIKPQFEVGKKEADRGKGIITDPLLHQQVIQEIQLAAKELGFTEKGLTRSPILGAKGNKEFLIYLVKN